MVIDARIGEGDITRLAAHVGRACVKLGIELTAAESCTGGGVAQALTRIAGSTRYFERGFVTYGNDAKEEMLGVSHATLLAHGAVSEATAREMAQGALAMSRARLAVAITGIAGPGGAVPGKPVGLVWFAWAERDGATQARSFVLPGDREAVRRQSVAIALQGFLDLMR
ncbi:MAG TPA: nicotinamide-nucleotide amidohydrolase family protein [Usitatibacter sp.]|jgi:nicotinamide-nucleotide amidase|nr:nicotinamide-nucleotide amidohydrolase family protein [Usitatibacter sp.]